MPNMSPNKVKMPEQDPNVRNKNFAGNKIDSSSIFLFVFILLITCFR